MLKVSDLNPKDTTLDEIHKIQRKIHRQNKGLSSAELAKVYNNSIKEISKKYHINFKVVSLKEA